MLYFVFILFVPCFYFSQCFETCILSEGKELLIHFEHFRMMGEGQAVLCSQGTLIFKSFWTTMTSGPPQIIKHS